MPATDKPAYQFKWLTVKDDCSLTTEPDISTRIELKDFSVKHRRAFMYFRLNDMGTHAIKPCIKWTDGGKEHIRKYRLLMYRDSDYDEPDEYIEDAEFSVALDAPKKRIRFTWQLDEGIWIEEENLEYLGDRPHCNLSSYPYKNLVPKYLVEMDVTFFRDDELIIFHNSHGFAEAIYKQDGETHSRRFRTDCPAGRHNSDGSDISEDPDERIRRLIKENLSANGTDPAIENGLSARELEALKKDKASVIETLDSGTPDMIEFIDGSLYDSEISDIAGSMEEMWQMWYSVRILPDVNTAERLTVIKDYYERALKIREQELREKYEKHTCSTDELDSEFLEIAECWRNLSILCRSWGDETAAEEYRKKSVSLRRWRV